MEPLPRLKSCVPANAQLTWASENFTFAFIVYCSKIRISSRFRDTGIILPGMKVPDCLASPRSRLHFSRAGRLAREGECGFFIIAIVLKL